MNAKLDKSVITHAVREAKNDESDLAFYLDELRLKGFTVAPSGLSPDEINEAREKIDLIYAKQIEEVGGEDNLRLMNDANIARALVAYDDLFIKVACLDIVHQICGALLGPVYNLMSQNGIINVPGTNHYQFTWHRDLNYQHFTSSRPIALSALVCIDPFNDVTGGTYVLQGSHLQEMFPSSRYVRANQQVITAEVGDIIIFDSMLYHRTGANMSTMTRRGVNHIITHPFCKQQYSFPHMLGPRPDIKDPQTRMMLGYGFEPAADALSWRKNKISIAEQKKVST